MLIASSIPNSLPTQRSLLGPVSLRTGCCHIELTPVCPDLVRSRLAMLRPNAIVQSVAIFVGAQKVHRAKSA
jgi:hypothetical protein